MVRGVFRTVVVYLVLAQGEGSAFAECSPAVVARLPKNSQLVSQLCGQSVEVPYASYGKLGAPTGYVNSPLPQYKPPAYVPQTYQPSAAPQHAAEAPASQHFQAGAAAVSICVTATGACPLLTQENPVKGMRCTCVSTYGDIQGEIR